MANTEPNITAVHFIENTAVHFIAMVHSGALDPSTYKNDGVSGSRFLIAQYRENEDIDECPNVY